jgi:hypothetical protein
LKESLEKRVTPYQIGKLPLGNRNGVSPHVRLEIALAHVSQQPAEAILHIPLAPPEGVHQSEHPRGQEQTPAYHLDGNPALIGHQVPFELNCRSPVSVHK